MKFTDLFVRRPVLATVVNLLILFAGIYSIQSIPVRQYPRSDSSVVTVTTAYIGANAELVRGFITTPLERVIAAADGIDYIDSSSAQGLSTITAHLRLNFDPNVALTQIQSKIAQVRNDLPPEAEAPVVNVETSDARIASLYLSFASEVLDPNQVTDYLTRVVQPRLSAVPGVQRADILGARTFAMRVWLRPDKMGALNLSPADVRRALANNNYLAALGATKGQMIQVNLVANTDLRSEEEFRQLVVKEDGDRIVRLADIADVQLGAESYEADVRFSGERATFMGIWVLPNYNTLEVIAKVRAEIPIIRQQLPAGLTAAVPYDSTAYIEDAIVDVFKTLAETVAIVIVVIFLFIGSVRATLVPVVAIPLSLIGACALMAGFGFTLNLLTLLAIVLAVGLVVDDAIVVLENCERHLREGKSRFEAAVLGARELVGPIIAMTITLAAVFAPIGLQGGLTGALFREFAFTLSGAVFISGVVALTLSPMMCSKLLKAEVNPRSLAARLDRLFDRLKVAYERILAGTLRTWPVQVVLTALIVPVAAAMYLFSPKEPAPREDQGVIFGIVQTAPNATLDQTVLFTEQVNKVFQSVPEVEDTFQVTFPGGGFSGLVTKPWGQRSRTTDQILPEVQAGLGKVPGINIFALTPSPLPGGGDFPVEFVLTTTAPTEQLAVFTEELVNKASTSGIFTFATTDLFLDLPQTEVVIDRDKVSALGLDLRQVGEDLAVLLSGSYVNRFNIDGRSYKVIPQVERVGRLHPDQLTDLYISGPGGESIPLSTIASLRDTVEPRSLNKFQQLNAARIQGGLIPGNTLDGALAFLEKEAAALPAEYSVDYAGESRQLRKEGSTLAISLLLACVLIYLVLAAQFESFRDPFIILFGSVPLALGGALIFTFLHMPGTWTDGWTTTINIYSQVGLITLVGLVAKNGILIVEFANQLRESGVERTEAVRQAAATRLRPILMTTAATVFGHLPLVFVTGAGAAARNSIGLVLVTGMTIGTLFTLFVVPSLYLFIARRERAAPPPVPA